MNRVAKHYTIGVKLFHLPAGKAPSLSDFLRYSVPSSFSDMQLIFSKTWWPG